jgi:hypothetical protein
MRSLTPLLLSVCIIGTFGCKRSAIKERERVDEIKNVPAERKPQDKIFIDFAKNWRELIHRSPEFALPVAVPSAPPEERWQPVVLAECVFSGAAGGLVPQVTLTWNEPAGEVPDWRPKVATAAQAQDQREGQAGVQRRRFDLALRDDGFARDYFSAILSGEKFQRFKLPPNSAFINDTAAVLSTGPGLFPQLVDFKTEILADPETRRPFAQHTLVLSDLSHGMSYTIRMDRPAGEGWSEERRFGFLTPVCPNSF